MSTTPVTVDELCEAWALLSDSDRVEGFLLLSRDMAEELFDRLESRDQADLLLQLPPQERRIWIRVLDPDDAADLIQEAPGEQREALLNLLDDTTRKEVVALLAYAEDVAGGLMNPRFARLRPDMRVDEAIRYLRRQTTDQIEHVYYAYVLDAGQKLLGVVSLRQLVMTVGDRLVREVMNTDVVTVGEQFDQERLGELFAEHDLMAVPVVDEDGRMKGIVTVDDIVDVFVEEATEDVHKLAGVEALEAPYLQIGLRALLRKRAGWLVALLLLEFATVLTMQHFAERIRVAAVLAFFVPLIISIGGNSGSQAATLVVRAMALHEIRLRDWWRVVRREVAAGVVLGGLLGLLGVAVVWVWHTLALLLGQQRPFDQHSVALAVTVACSILTVALWGTLIGSMLPFVLRRLRFDPASA